MPRIASSFFSFFLCVCIIVFCVFFFFNDTATTEIYTLSLHDALPISNGPGGTGMTRRGFIQVLGVGARSEEHTSELQSQSNLVCRLLLEKKKKKKQKQTRDDNTNKKTKIESAARCCR